MNTKELEATYTAAVDAQNEVKAQLSKALKKAKDAVESEYGPAIDRAQAAVSAASMAMADARIADALEDPRVGQKVTKKEWQSGGGYTRGGTYVDVFGIVEVVTRETVFPANMSSYGRPQLGQLIVRRLDSAGKPGKKIDTGIGDWKSSEEVEAAKRAAAEREAEEKAKADAEAQAAKEAEERAQYEALKAKFGGAA